VAKLDSYRAAGVDYSVLDRVKAQAIERARATSHLLALAGGREYERSRGASAYVFALGTTKLAMVVEGLGTKALIAEQYRRATGENRFADIATDAVASIVNDVISVGARPVAVNAYFATGSADWYGDEERATALLEGWQRA
jgi:phosphoribosylformylglycinamidine cyclo-ligase